MPARFFLHLAGRRGAGVFAVVHVAARQLPDPPVHDEAVALGRRGLSQRPDLRAWWWVVAGRKLAPELVRATPDALRSGMNPRQAGRAAGVSAEYARQLNKRMGGVYRPPGTSYDARYLDREERYEIARLAEAGLSQRQVAARVGRPCKSGGW